MGNSLVLPGVTPLWRVAQWVSRAPPHDTLLAFLDMNAIWVETYILSLDYETLIMIQVKICDFFQIDLISPSESHDSIWHHKCRIYSESLTLIFSNCELNWDDIQFIIRERHDSRFGWLPVTTGYQNFSGYQNQNFAGNRVTAPADPCLLYLIYFLMSRYEKWNTVRFIEVC